MKKYIFGFAILVSLLAAGCRDSPSSDDESKSDGIKHIDTIEKITVNSDYLSEFDSFYDADNDYYLFTMGTVSNVPLETPVFFYYGGKGEIKHTFSETATAVSRISTTVQNVTQDRMSWDRSLEISGSVGLSKVMQASVSSKISETESSEHTATETKIYSEFMERTNSSQRSVTIKFDERYRAGYYAYLVSATVKVYTVLVKSRETEDVRVGTYNELLSLKYSFAYNEFDDTLPVDKSQKFEFSMPDVGSLPAPMEFIGTKKEPDDVIDVDDKYAGYTKITNVQEFAKISENLSGKYVLLSDLDFKGTRITPIGG